ncbi:hypothetical protein [Clostridium pasteurianum]|uniref:Uncharacterized protein n=1 Tax=Clostridium pasteurianum BC1 TaxID=86416 RepID=R4JXT8_CLOPA|nr:hypothetical protein [Clostridium pasteurianum]AGK95622.1 hypothetical protein Clopa_0574 [Clostridium pasteurianum BC1]
MDEELDVKIDKIIRFKKGECIKVSVELSKIESKQLKSIKDFLDTMFKEIKELF